MKLRVISLVAMIGLPSAGAARADIVSVVTRGVVEFSVIGGSMAGVQAGDPVVMSYSVDSNVFVNSPNFPTRGYPLLLDTFSMTVAGRPVPIVNPQPDGQTAYFVMRNNDPGVDGFVLSTNVDFPVPVTVTIPGLAPEHELDFLVTFNDGNVFPSLDILNALGTYDASNISVYNWSIGRFGNPGALYTYETITLSVVPEPSSMLLLGVVSAGMAGYVRRRRLAARCLNCN